jgi:hypothetical protein
VQVRGVDGGEGTEGTAARRQGVSVAVEEAHTERGQQPRSAVRRRGPPDAQQDLVGAVVEQPECYLAHAVAGGREGVEG